jgi:hypothetical protein
LATFIVKIAGEGRTPLRRTPGASFGEAKDWVQFVKRGEDSPVEVRVYRKSMIESIERGEK